MHLSTRLVWHDRAWDGHICDHPSKNAYCMVQQHIREGRDDDKEDDAAGLPLAGLKTWQPPCSRDPIAFSACGYTITHKDPLEFRQLPSVPEEIPPYSVCPSPYLDRIITSEDGADGSIDAAEIERITRKKILMEG